MTPTLYLHGLPGGAEELSLGAAAAGWTVPDRLGWRLGYEAGLAALAENLPPRCQLFGFSLGAMTALRLAALQPDRVERVTLASAAAPLELGSFLSAMAGAPVFRAAAERPDRLARMTAAQAALARLAPGLVLRLLFAGTDAGEGRLARRHRALLTMLLRRSYGPGRAAYLAELAAYVAPWAWHLAAVQAPVTLHHGASDRWSPPAMAEALAAALPRARLVRHAGLGHYRTLAAALDGQEAA